VAAVDLGSASTQLLMTNGTERLRRGVDTTMGGSSLSPAGQVRPEVIAPGALDRVAGALARFAEIIDRRGVPVTRVVAAAAARRAANRDELSELVAATLGTELEVIDSADEARLSFLGAVSDRSLLPAGGPVITIDIGGGSTELALGTAAGPERACSLPIGAMLVTEAYLTSDPPRPEELSMALSVVELHLDDVRREAPELAAALGSASVLALGSVTTVAAIEVGLVGDDPANGEGDGPLHGFELSRAAVEDVFRTIATESRRNRAHNPGLPPTRVDSIVGACAILVEAMRRFDLGHVVVSQRGLLDGVARELTGDRS
jgi:exopolyphosphatase/guanosine-5'-triphosphate,3'-diphosphate pyrophosphatase